MSANSQVAKIPHSFDLINWPPGLWPHNGRLTVDRKGNAVVHPAVRWLVVSNRIELMNAGALSRPGRTLVILAPAYLGWLQHQAERVAGFDDTRAATAARIAKRKPTSRPHPTAA